jgi:uncharacterized LabA/DUF88 family protein
MSTGLVQPLIQPAQRVIAYVDGFNLYFGMRDAGLRACYWLDLVAMVASLLKPHQTLLHTKYFTARIDGARPGDTPAQALKRNEKRKRQGTYLDALDTLVNLSVYEGHYLLKPVTCRACGASFQRAEEKMTDVYIATELLTDTFLDNYDLAIVVSGDTDLVPPIRAIRSYFPHKHVVACFPPRRANNHLRKICNGYMDLFPNTLTANQLPDPVVTAAGVSLSKPAKWV